jgi:hypothetical protein
MSNFHHRLDQIESAISPPRLPLICIVFGDDDPDSAVARMRAERKWPDDGAHPVKVINVRWGKDD